MANYFTLENVTKEKSSIIKGWNFLIFLWENKTPIFRALLWL